MLNLLGACHTDIVRQCRGSRPRHLSILAVIGTQVSHFLAISHDDLIDFLRLAPLSQITGSSFTVCGRCVDEAENLFQVVLD